MHNIPKTMKAARLNGHGEFDKLEVCHDIPVPRPSANDVLIKIGAAGVNNTDINTRIGWYSKSDDSRNDASWAGEALIFPRIQGIDVCGEIVAVGENVNQKRIGERVLVEPCIREANSKTLAYPWFLGSECNGGFAQYVVVSTKHAYPIESDFSDIELASFPCSYSTAENMLTKANVCADDTVLITGASGGVGSAAVQLVKARGAKVIAVTSYEKSSALIALGAEKTLTRAESVIQALGENSVDVVIDLVGGKNWAELIKAIKPGGRYTVSGAIAGALVELDIRDLYLKDLTFFGCTALEEGVFQNLVNHIANKNIKPLVAEIFPLEDIVKAQKSFLQKKYIGKIVLTINN